jgi:NADH dehydrogenase [ubiquinone] 1 alpha subcomplex assembly factor 1
MPIVLLRLTFALALFMPQASTAAELRLFPPAPGARLEWRAINDGVMGGVSQGGAEVTRDGRLVFAGEVSLERNGGFASVRSAPAPLGVPDARAVRLEVRGDGRRYKLNLKTDEAFDGVQYQAAFATPAGQWTTLTLPLEAFAPKHRGREVPDAPPLDPARIVTLGFLIADRQAGPFRLEVRAIDLLRSLR